MLILYFASGSSVAQSAEYLLPDSGPDLQLLRTLAGQGDIRAAFLLGTQYASGGAGTRDDSEAVRWFRLSGEKGLAEAQYNLGIMYATGRGVARDIVQAAYWYEQAAEQGVLEAQFNLGTFYGLGHGVAQDDNKAAYWLGKAAAQGLAEAEFNMGVFYEHGRGVRVDLFKALEWYARAARKGYLPAQARIDNLQQQTTVMAPETPQQVVAEDSQDSSGEVLVLGAALEDPLKTDVDQSSVEIADDTDGHGILGMQWVRRQNPSHFTLQVVSQKNLEDARQFIIRRGLNDTAAYFTSNSNGTLWHSVIYGIFIDRTAAIAASEALPASLKGIQPWVRNVGEIQKIMQP